MEKQQLLAQLERLQAELEQADQVDDAKRAEIKAVADEIHSLLASDGPATSEESESLGGRLQDSLLEFEAEHPQLTKIVNQMAAALANLGI